MLPAFLIPETTAQENGSGPVLEISTGSRIVQLTLGINRIVEQESLDITIWGSADRNDFGKLPLAAFPQKFYCGTYSILLDLTAHPEVRWLKAQWKMNRWGRGSLKPLFSFYIFAQAAPVRATAGASV